MGTLTNSEDPDEMPHNALYVKVKTILRTETRHNLEMLTCDPFKYIMDNPIA